MQKKKKLEESGIRSKAYLCVVKHTKGVGSWQIFFYIWWNGRNNKT